MSKASLEWENKVGYPGIWVAGCDEVGRGCLAGPVVAAAVVLPRAASAEADRQWLARVGDSKALSPRLREELEPRIKDWAASWAIGEASVEEIDRVNILRASHLAMVRAVKALEVTPEHLLVDGKMLPDLRSLERRLAATAIVKGDALCFSIAAASILAKVYRDQLMVELERDFPGYGFAVHKGYPTAQHTEALKKLGVTPLHRRSFGPVAALLA